jgi:glycosyltransferase involved in cell wall biosynthesis
VGRLAGAGRCDVAMSQVHCAIDFASNWEIRGGVWRYGIELTKALVKLLGPEHVSLPCFDRLPEERITELENTQATVRQDGFFTRYDRLEAMKQRNGRFVPWKTVLPWFYGPKLQQRLFQEGLGEAQVYHAIFTCRGKPRRGVTVGTIHDLIPYLHTDGAGFSKERFLSMIEDFRRWATMVIVPSHATKHDLVEHLQYPEEQIRVVYHGIDATIFRPGVPFANELLSKHGLQPGKYLLYVGALERRKNIERLVQAYHQAMGDRRDMPLVLSGTIIHQMHTLQQALSDGTGRVRHIGYVSDAELPGLYRGARGLVHVAIAEGFGFTPPEAMACATPVIAAQQSATGEVVGDTGLLVDAYSVPAIADAIRRLVSENVLHDELSVRGQKRATQFTWERCAAETYAVYQEAWERRKST